jgi:hypothetical protein
VMRGYVQARADLIRAEGGDPDALAAHVHDGARGWDVLRNFFTRIAGYGLTPHLSQSASRAPVPHETHPSSPISR